MVKYNTLQDTLICINSKALKKLSAINKKVPDGFGTWLGSKIKSKLEYEHHILSEIAEFNLTKKKKKVGGQQISIFLKKD